jgi:hypothetical protein
MFKKSGDQASCACHFNILEAVFPDNNDLKPHRLKKEWKASE